MKKNCAWVLALLFIVALLPIASTMIVFHPDERHYSEAAIHMISSGDFLTPKEIDGTLRLIKPPITYWAIAGNYALWGISPFSLRLSFILAAGLIVFYIYKIGQDLCYKNDVGEIAALILISSPQFIMAAFRANPDILLTLFILISANGFLHLIIKPGPQKHHYWEAYLGAGIAAMTKGLLPILFVIYSLLFAYLTFKKTKTPFKKIIHAPSMFTGLFIAVIWYLLIMRIYGLNSITDFYNDQIGHKITPSYLKLLIGPALFILAYLLNLLPWSAIALTISIKQKAFIKNKDHLSSLYDIQKFILIWTAISAFIFGINKDGINMRYMTPFLPLIALWLAAVISRAKESIRRHVIKTTIFIITFIIFLLTITTALIYTLINDQIWATLLLFIITSVYLIIILIEKRNKWITACKALAIGILLAFPLFDFALSPIIIPEISLKIVTQLNKIDPTNKYQIVCISVSTIPSKIKIASRGKRMPLWYNIDHKPIVDYSKRIRANNPNAILIVSEKFLPGVKNCRSNYKWHTVINKGHYKWKDIIKAVKNNNLQEYIETYGKKFFIGIPLQNHPVAKDHVTQRVKSIFDLL